ncbi:MAG: 16S rRNA (guanine(527)-N(7))-methyltransferase RsmG [Ignavibacteria bacterium]
MKNLKDSLKKILELNKLEFNQEQVNLVCEYVRLLLEHNKFINLISRKDENHILEKHIIPCLIFSTMFQNFDQSVLDIGTGGGLPGIPFSIVNQKSRITLIDSIKKKINAVKDIVQKLGLKNVETIWTRAEDKNFVENYKNKYDLIISRATANLQNLIEYSQPLCKYLNSKLAVMKGGDQLDDEIVKAKKRFNYIAIQKIPLIYLPENPENINKKFIIIVERMNGRK